MIDKATAEQLKRQLAAAERTNDLAAENVEVMQRIAEALERIASLVERSAVAPAAVPAPPPAEAADPA